MILSEAISAVAVAIAYAEGFYVTGSRPARNHNPGDLTFDTIGRAVGHDGIFIVYANDNDGWDALKRQVELMFTNASSVYNSDMTINQIAQKYTTTQQSEWAMNVARTLGVSPDTKLSDIVNEVTQVAETGISIGIVVLAVLALWYLRKPKH